MQANDNFLAFTGYEREELAGMRLPDSSLPVVTNVSVLKAINELFRGEGEAKEIEWEDESGECFFLVKLIPTVFDDGSPGMTIILEDVTEVRKALREKERLIDEIHLRIRNNLQQISSLINIQSAGVADEQVKNILSEAQRRIMALSLVHENMHHEDQQHISANEYIVSLAGDLRTSMSVPDDITVLVHAGKVLIPIETAIPFGLLLNELLSNAFSHSFADGRSGSVSITVEETSKNLIKLIVEDDGIGLPKDFDLEKTDSLGISMVRNLVERQMSGTIEAVSDGGAKFIINFNSESERSVRK
ncbi:sensor histidine kinase [Methanochimaera problematica]|uniref:sensor histidine kinase n=1 Tax=Methanochimaera problematica TaxID=2609417 RepID=UPI0029390D3B|nr:histidine kinase dimerization/phosphoacceptor domain -containing protein [Methanoplanus sp. FWC-SCC4]